LCPIAEAKDAHAYIAIVGRQSKPVLEVVGGGDRVVVGTHDEQSRLTGPAKLVDAVVVIRPSHDGHGRTTVGRSLLEFEERDVSQRPLSQDLVLEEVHLRTVS